MNYEKRINKVIDFIGENLDRQLTLDQLSSIASFSKYHFHRLFTAYTGLSLSCYVKWLRLKRAAHQLSIQKDRPIIEIALNAGFESHESFTRAFKKICGQSPSDFRLKSNWTPWNLPRYLVPKHTLEHIMTVTIKSLPKRRLAVFEHRGDFLKLVETANKLVSWAKKQSLPLHPGEVFGFAYDDPKKVPTSEWRFDLGMTIPAQLKLTSEVIEKNLPEGRYAVTTHKGARDQIGDSIYSLYRDWLPKQQEELGDLPCIFCYYNFDHEVAETELITEIWVLLK